MLFNLKYSNRSRSIIKMTVGMKSYVTLNGAIAERRNREARLHLDMAKFRPYRIAATIGTVPGLVFNLVILCTNTWMIREGNYLIIFRFTFDNDNSFGFLGFIPQNYNRQFALPSNKNIHTNDSIIDDDFLLYILYANASVAVVVFSCYQLYAGQL